MTEFDKAWREFIDEVTKALRIPAMLDWLAAFIGKERIDNLGPITVHPTP